MIFQYRQETVLFQWLLKFFFQRVKLNNSATQADMINYLNFFLFSRVKMWFSILLGGIVLVLLLTVAFLTRNYGKLDNVRSLIIISNKTIWTVNVFFFNQNLIKIYLGDFFSSFIVKKMQLKRSSGYQDPLLQTYTDGQLFCYF